MPFRNLVLLTAAVMMQQSCYPDFEDRGPRYDIRQISVGQTSVYFKREVRGRNYDGLSISGDGNLCNGPSPRTDFFVEGMSPGQVFYNIDGDELHIYSQSDFTPPQAGGFPVKVVQENVDPVRYDPESVNKLGYTELIFKNDSLKYCGE
jgi:hypothetical protein